MRARYYHPQLPRFISEEPIKDGLNWYCFADNNPIKYLDPTGEFAITLTTLLMVAVATAATYVASTIIHNYLDSPQGQAAVQSMATGIQNKVTVARDILFSPILPVPGNKEWTKGVNGIPANRRNAEGNTVFTPPGRIGTGNFITMPAPRSIQDSLEILVPPPTTYSFFDCMGNWGNESTLQDHFDRHGADFDAKSPQDYVYKANQFYNNRANYQVKINSDGTIRVYDPKTNTFGAYNPNGTTRTLFKPSAGQEYFNRQPGSGGNE